MANKEFNDIGYSSAVHHGPSPGRNLYQQDNKFYSTTPVEDSTSPMFLKEEPINNTLNVGSKKVFWGKHRDKEIEYYCKLCHSIVCPKCMFADHNGHELAQLEDVTSIIKQNIQDLNKLLLNTKRITEDKKNYVVYLKKEIDKLKEVQLKNIDQGFAALIKRMEDKRDSLKEEFKAKYVAESMTMYNKLTVVDKYFNDISNIEIVYEELFKFINKNIDAKVWSKINDISSFISKSIEDLEKIAKSKGYDKSEAFIKPELKPLTLNVDKAYDIIGKFNLISSKPSKKNQVKEQNNNVRVNRQEDFEYEDYQPSPAMSRHQYESHLKNHSNSKNSDAKSKNDYDEYDKYVSREKNYSTMAHKGDYTAQKQTEEDDFPVYYKSNETFNQHDANGPHQSSENIANRASINAYGGRYSKQSFDQNEYDDEVDNDIRNVEDIQKELHQMDMNKAT